MKKTTIQEWAEKRVTEIVASIKFYIDNGIEREAALEMALAGSTLGSGYHAQIRYEIKNYQEAK
jgi:hypothetical protein